MKNRIKTISITGLVIILVPFLIMGFYSYHELIDKQELQLKNGYDDTMGYIQYNLDRSLSEVKGHAMFISANPILQAALSNTYYSVDIALSLRESLEPYMWYHITSPRSYINDIKIYTYNNLKIGNFLLPFENIKNEHWINEFIENKRRGLLYIEDSLFYVYSIMASSNPNRTIGFIVCYIDKDKLIEQNVYLKKDIGYNISIDNNIIRQRQIDGKYIKVENKSNFTGIMLECLIPTSNIKLESKTLVFAVFSSILLLILLYLVLSYIIFKLNKEIEIEREKLESMRLSALKAQINPHFLYNILSMINWKAKYANIKEISDITQLISSFYRTSLNSGEDKIEVYKEIENIESYMKLKSLLMDNIFTYEIICEDKIKHCNIVNFILQPIVENALIHGIAPKEKGHIKILFEDKEKDILIKVFDDGVGISKFDKVDVKGSGYGLKNIDERIKILCGKKYGVSIESTVNGTCVNMLVKKL